MQLYLVRHGETDWNAQGLVAGQADIPLNERGIIQAETTRDKILAQNLKFDAVYSSPLQRVRQTAEIITGGQYDIIFDDRLKERDAGEFSGHPSQELFDNSINYLDLDLNSGEHGVEPIRNFDARVHDFFHFLQQKHANEDLILIITSSGFIRRLVSIIDSVDPESLPRFQNGEIYRYII